MTTSKYLPNVFARFWGKFKERKKERGERYRERKKEREREGERERERERETSIFFSLQKSVTKMKSERKTLFSTSHSSFLATKKKSYQQLEEQVLFLLCVRKAPMISQSHSQR